MKDTAGRLEEMRMKLSEIRGLCKSDFDSSRKKILFNEIARINEVFLPNLDRAILSHNPNLSPLCNLDLAIEELKNNSHAISGSTVYNTWPYGVPSDTYPCFLAICRGKTTLNDAFKTMQAQSHKIAKKYGSDREIQKLVILLTDKWDQNKFVKYEKNFLNHALHDDVWYIFILVTDYGYTQIPFLPNDKSILREIGDEVVEDDVTFEDMLKLLEGNPFEYHHSDGTWNLYKNETYQFDYYDMMWYKNDLYGKSKGHIPKRDLRKFLENAIWIADSNKVKFMHFRAVDAGSNCLSIFGKTIEWDFVDDADNSMKKLIRALDEFINECEKKRM